MCARCAGYFSLNVPSGLTLYWFTNNILTTAQQASARRLPSHLRAVYLDEIVWRHWGCT